MSAKFIDVKHNMDLGLDHSAVILTPSERIIRKMARSLLVNKTDWEGFQDVLQMSINLILELKQHYS